MHDWDLMCCALILLLLMQLPGPRVRAFQLDFELHRVE